MLLWKSQSFIWGPISVSLWCLLLDRAVPCHIKFLRSQKVVHISCGDEHTAALTKVWIRIGFRVFNDFRPMVLRSILFQGNVCSPWTWINILLSLLQDGGLFTFGGGSWGQLGHGSTSNELLPRRVLELMGTEVSQITCGRYFLFKTWSPMIYSGLRLNPAFCQAPYSGVCTFLWCGLCIWR